MAVSTYDEALARLLADEGGYANHPADPGGPTNFGITIIDYRKYVKPGATAADVKAMRVAEAKAIYRAKYWDAMRCDELPAGVDYAVFDYGVNSGIGRAGKVLRRVLGLTDQTSVVTDGVIAAARRAEASRLVVAICDERLAFLKSLKTWPVFGRGWGRRVAAVKAAASQMTEDRGRTTGEARMELQPRSPSSVVRPPSSGKGAVPGNNAARKTAAGGAIAAGAAAAQAAGWDPSTVTVIALVTAAAAAGAWVFWRWRRKRQQAARHA